MKEKTSAKNIAAKGSFALAFSVGSVLFSAHAGGGFATGNQANTYYVGLGWLGPISAVIAMLLLTLTMREAMIMYNSRGLKSHKELFETLYHPLDKCYVLFEVFFYIMVLMAVAAAISGADLVRKVSTYMGIAILVTAITIYTIGIFKSKTLFTVMSADFSAVGFRNIPKAILNAFTYAGFQCVTLPTMIACGTPLKGKKDCSKSMWISFVMNSVALVLSVFMLMSWKGYYSSVEGGSTIPTLTVCTEMGMKWLTVIYGICLLLCLISTGVTTTFGFVARFENHKVFKKIKSQRVRSAVVSAFIIILSMTISLVGLTNIIKYGYGYCGYLAIAIVVVPFLTVGVYKNRKYIKEHPECK